MIIRSVDQPISRKTRDASAWGPETPLTGMATQYVDTAVEKGAGYEYRIKKLAPDHWGEGYVYAGVELPLVESRLNDAVAMTDFAQLRALEDAQGFRERPAGVARFFRQGTAGAWRTVLSDAQVARVVAMHGAMMRQFLYVGKGGTPDAEGG